MRIVQGDSCHCYPGESASNDIIEGARVSALGVAIYLCYTELRSFAEIFSGLACINGFPGLEWNAILNTIIKGETFSRVI